MTGSKQAGISTASTGAVEQNHFLLTTSPCSAGSAGDKAASAKGDAEYAAKHTADKASDIADFF